MKHKTGSADAKMKDVIFDQRLLSRDTNGASDKTRFEVTELLKDRFMDTFANRSYWLIKEPSGYDKHIVNDLKEIKHNSINCAICS